MQSKSKLPGIRVDSIFRLPLFLQPPEWISMSLVVIFSVQFLLMIFISFFLPILFRYIFINNENNYERVIEFTYDSCKAGNDYHGSICSFLQSNVNLIEDGFSFKENLPYNIGVNLVLADSEKNRKISSFITSISLITSASKDSILLIKKVVNLKWSWFKSTLIWWRNFFFYPLYLFGILDDNIISVDMLFTNKFTINDTNLIVDNLLIQIESRQVEVNNAKVYIIPYRTFLQSLLFEFPIITYCVLLFIFFSLLLILFSLFWIKKVNDIRNCYYKSKEDSQKLFDSLDSANSNSEEIVQLKFKNKHLKSTHITNEIKTPSPPSCKMHTFSDLDSIPGWKSQDDIQPRQTEENDLRKRNVSKFKM
ncbi:Adipose-regulatory protein, Seipin family-containing protein [Strongyloides ratti]|uniref:Seipin n=1 Tax=Strongyloides ratti TaxID=34506 RepID=A0A090L1A3_STRRB|nr:Adipose-regulatory protein, Seipin family-containing protein [Strongyloides ratti]CEF63486.1 Adipose-regulatory protein, Seipin family-containing protein [Strongyloides ratti]